MEECGWLGGDATAWFDTRYFVQTMRQTVLIYQYDMLTAGVKANWKVRVGTTGLDGGKWVARAVKMGEGIDAALARMAKCDSLFS